MAELFDQNTPFGRLALAHVLLTAGDTLLTISLAGSLFFSISPQAAKGKVLLYLLITVAPFSVVSPVLGPIIDRSRGARRTMVVLSALCRAGIALVMAGDLKSLLLFPEAFAMLVLSKLYLVTKGALVPLLVEHEEGARPAPEADLRTPPLGVPPVDTPRVMKRDDLATINARLGLLAALAGFVASVPALLVLKLGGAPWVLRLDVLVFIAATVAGIRLPIRRLTAPHPGGFPGAPVAGMPKGESVKTERTRPSRPIDAFGIRAVTHAEVTLARTAMSVLKMLVGFLTFLLAFDLRRMHAATWWYGFVLGSSVAGSLVGVILVTRIRRRFTEQQVLAVSLWVVTLAAGITVSIGGLVVQAFLAFVLGLAASAAKPGFDALVQRYLPTEAQGRAFARFETSFQLAWVFGALIPVIFWLPFPSGDIVIGAVSGVSGLSYLASRRALRHR
jgi:hypothetical protein